MRSTKPESMNKLKILNVYMKFQWPGILQNPEKVIY